MQISASGIKPASLDDFSAVWDKEYGAGYTDEEPTFYRHYARDSMTVYARADVGGNFSTDFLMEFMSSHPHLQMEIIEEDYDTDNRMRHLIEGDIVEHLREVRYYEEPQYIDWPD